MSVSIRIDEQLYDEAKMTAQGEKRTISGQIEYWAMVGKAALDNPGLPADFIRDILISKRQDKALSEPFIPEKWAKLLSCKCLF